ncbi:MAG TPA: sugar phosphate isomerase/epimerase [Acidobacteriaceae bacterium]|jgi:sugar phosphate isomerase/epimerase
MKAQLPRRSFLLNSAALAAGVAVGPGLVAGSSLAAFAQAAAPRPTALPPLPKSPVKLGLATYTFRKFDIPHLIDFAHQIRTPYLNIKDMHLPMKPLDKTREQADAYRKAGFQLTGAGNVDLKKDNDDDMRAKFEYCKAAGITTMICIPTHASLPRAEKFVKEYNIRMAIHNHGPEEPEFPSPVDVLKAVKSMDPRIGCCVDVGHTMRAGTDPVEALKLAGPRLFDIHMKDLAKANDKDSQVAVGEGIIPVREIFQQLIRMKYAGFVDLEYEINADNPLPGVMESFAYMRGVLRGLGYDTAE